MDPAKGQPLGAAYIGPGIVDAAVSLRVEKGTGTFGPGCLLLKELRISTPDVQGLHLKYRELVDTAVAAPPAAAQSLTMVATQSLRGILHPPINLLQFHKERIQFDHLKDSRWKQRAPEPWNGEA
jgi:hypothetical protein